MPVKRVVFMSRLSVCKRREPKPWLVKLVHVLVVVALILCSVLVLSKTSVDRQCNKIIPHGFCGVLWLFPSPPELVWLRQKPNPDQSLPWNAPSKLKYLTNA